VYASLRRLVDVKKPVLGTDVRLASGGGAMKRMIAAAGVSSGRDCLRRPAGLYGEWRSFEQAGDRNQAVPSFLAKKPLNPVGGAAGAAPRFFGDRIIGDKGATGEIDKAEVSFRTLLEDKRMPARRRWRNVIAARGRAVGYSGVLCGQMIFINGDHMPLLLLSPGGKATKIFG
jgi:hypothetical protein